MKFIELEPLPIESQGSDYVRRCRIHRLDSSALVDTRELWFQFSKSITPPDDLDCDSYLLAIIMDAMAEDREIRVKGSVSLGLLANLIEYQGAWNKWLPETYTVIDIKVDAIRENEQPVPGAICAFSGGADSMFSVWRHSQGKNSYRTINIKLCTLVHGFDIPLEDTTAFSNIVQKAITTLDDVDIEFTPIKTNYREISCADWRYANGTALIATLANFKSVAGTCIVGSSSPYNHLAIPWGSTPIVDFLLSSDNFIVMHDGASHSRTEKVKEISDWEVGIENLRVCWRGDLKGGNCGTCEKCIRTKLNFLAAGKSIPDCLNKGNINIKSISLKSRLVIDEWAQIVDDANKNGIKDAWVNEAKKVIKNKVKRNARRAIVRKIRKFILNNITKKLRLFRIN